MLSNAPHGYFSPLIVTVFVNQAKRPLFDGEERVELVRQVTAHIPGVVVDQSQDLLVQYAENARLM